ncbi:MAG: efflux RND transporter periplasmic adaptor subunit [Acidobacteria bacterium]|nr:efflux RND transporter periplasmic adaptor subunit [Acidobacteriota bacterium]
MKLQSAALMLLSLFVGCKKEALPPQQAHDEPRRLAVTHWTGTTELFMEYSSLLAGQTSRAAIHLTQLGSFKPLTEGKVLVELTAGDEISETFSTEGPTRPGIFGVNLQPKHAGTYTLVVRLNSARVADVHELGQVTVYRDAAQAASTPEQPEGEGISFLKEQQWTMDFATEAVKERVLRESTTAPGEVRPRPGGEVEVISPVAGRLAVSSSIPVVGARVTKGQVLASVIPRSSSPSDRAALEFGVADATSALQLAQKDQDRATRLLASGAIPAKRLDEASANLKSIEARLKAAQARLTQLDTTRRSEGDGGEDGQFLLRSPLSGVIAESLATPGANVEEGTKLYRIVAIKSVQVVAMVPEAEISSASLIVEGEVELAGKKETLRLSRPRSVSRVIDPESRTFSIIFEIPNRDPMLAIGQVVSVRLFTAANTATPTVPVSAVIDDGGRPVVFVQVAGESFARRPVRLGSQEAGYQQLLEGVKSGERVVTRGAYLIRLAALSTQIPAHGHVH